VKGVFVWNTSTWLPLPALGTDHFYGMAFSPDSRSLAACGWRNPDVLMWDLVSGQEVMRLKKPDGFRSSWSTSMAFSPDGRFLAS
jgi:WD40 repeat protein